MKIYTLMVRSALRGANGERTHAELGGCPLWGGGAAVAAGAVARAFLDFEELSGRLVGDASFLRGGRGGQVPSGGCLGLPPMTCSWWAQWWWWWW